jgi:hypothetical protein
MITTEAGVSEGALVLSVQVLMRAQNGARTTGDLLFVSAGREVGGRYSLNCLT